MTSIFKNDPTRTIILRKKFVDQFRARFNIIKRLSNESIVLNDCFGIKKSRVSFSRIEQNQYGAIPEGQFSLYPNSEKISKYSEWLEKLEDQVIFQQIQPPRSLVAAPFLWANSYITTAYQRGLRWAINNIKRDKGLIKTLNLSKNELYNVNIADMITTLRHKDAISILYSRVMTDLKGITSKMNAQITRILAEGVESGSGARIIAKLIAEKIDKIGIHRATLLARTEIVRAHHIASIHTYKDYGIYKIKVEAEWSTAGDSRVCELCAPLDGKVYTLDEVMYKIPVHPQCRCAALPIVD